MIPSPMTESHKRALVVAYYLSRFDRKGVHALGYTTSTEAFHNLSERLGVKQSTLKHMRDQFDPYCSQVRVGWHQRPILRSRANVILAFDALGEATVAEIVREILNSKGNDTHQFTAAIGIDESNEDVPNDECSAFANRIRTGETAETIFMERFCTLTMFHGRTLEDTRKLGIGFDFRVLYPSSFQAIEVKGIRESSGYVSFTDKEWSVAQTMNQDYILAVVRSMETSPKLDLIYNPVAVLEARMRTVESVAVCWNAKV